MPFHENDFPVFIVELKTSCKYMSWGALLADRFSLNAPKDFTETV